MEKIERDWDDRGRLTLLMAFQFCVFPPGSFSQDAGNDAHRCVCVCMYTCTRHPRESSPMHVVELLLP